MAGQARRPLIVVLGASGFIGSAVTAEFAGQPVRLRTVARRPVVLPPGSLAEHEHHGADLTEPGSIAAAVAGADAVIYLVAHISGQSAWRASADDPEAERVNLQPVRDLVEALRARGGSDTSGGCPAVLFAGTTMQAGLKDTLRIDGSESDAPHTAYPLQKLSAEWTLKSAGSEGVLRAVSLRFPTVYGRPRGESAEAKGVVSVMAQRALEGRPLTMWDGTVRRDLIHVDDVARAFTAALRHTDVLAGRHWVVGSGQGVRLSDLFGDIAAAVAARTGEPPVPVETVEPPDYAEAMDFHSVEIDSSAFRQATGWEPRVTLAEGLLRTVESLAPTPASARPGPLR
ncbi:NAD-dependent epimerase/dehydratase [Streptomyces sp. NPDC055189]